MLQGLWVYSELGKSTFSFCAPNIWNYQQHILKIKLSQTTLPQGEIVLTEYCPLLIFVTVILCIPTP